MVLSDFFYPFDIMAKIIIIHQIYKDRGGEYGFNFQHVLPGSGRYENIDDEAESFQSNTYKVKRTLIVKWSASP